MSKQIPELTIITTPTAGQESIIETVVARHDTYATSRMTLAQIFTLGSISGAIKVVTDALAALIAGNTSSINTLSSTKLNIAGGTRTGLTANRAIITDGSGVETYLTGTTTQVIGFDGAGKPIAVTPTVDINGLPTKNAPVGADYLMLSDSASSFTNKKTLLSDISGYMLPFYGYASDGNATISTTVTLTRDMYYNNLTISAGATYNPAGFKVFVAGILTISGGTIQNNGSNASTFTGGAGGSGGDTGPNATTTSPGSNSSNITNTAITITDASGAAGACGNFARAGGSAGANTAYIGISNSMVNQILSGIFVGTSGLSVNVLNPTCAGASGGSGNSGGYGGGGGGSGGKIIFIAKIVNISGGTININGGAGGIGTNTSNAQAGGGGGGGSGGLLMFLTESMTRSAGTISLVGGNGGNGGIDTTTGYGGNGGNGGMGGRVYVIAKTGSIGSCTLTGGSAGALGTGGAGNGSNGSAGSAGSVITATYS